MAKQMALNQNQNQDSAQPVTPKMLPVKPQDTTRISGFAAFLFTVAMLITVAVAAFLDGRASGWVIALFVTVMLLASLYLLLSVKVAQQWEKAVVLRLDKLRADPERDHARLAELKPQEQRYWRLVAERKGVTDERMEDFRWLLEELRVSFFAQELRTPQPVSIKRLEKAWSQLNS